MNFLKIVSLLFTVYASLEANYCIQVLTTNKSERNAVITRAQSSQYDLFNDVRVERRGNYLVFRVGDYGRYGDASKDMRKIRQFNRDAYIRKCDFIREKALYIKNDREDTLVQERQKEFRPQVNIYKPRVAETTKRAPVAPVQSKKNYTRKKELKYTNTKYSTSLWSDCKKCFVPVYEEESDINYDSLSPRVKESVPTPVKKRVTKPKEDTFWSDEIVVEESKPKRYIKAKSKNKFNIDEQFLP